MELANVLLVSQGDAVYRKIVPINIETLTLVLGVAPTANASN